jgi:hypothetical protein
VLDGEPLWTGSKIELSNGEMVTVAIRFDVGGKDDNFDNLMTMMFHLFDVQPLLDPAFILAAGGPPSPDPFDDLMTAMFAIFE